MGIHPSPHPYFQGEIPMIDYIKNQEPIIIICMIVAIIAVIAYGGLKLRQYLKFVKGNFKDYKKHEAAKISAKKMLQNIPRELLNNEAVEKLLRIETALVATIMDDGSGQYFYVHSDDDSIFEILKHLDEIMIIEDEEISEKDNILLTTKTAYNEMQLLKTADQEREAEASKQQAIKLCKINEVKNAEEEKQKAAFFEKLDTN
jgi:hypothetical protein